MPKRKLSNIWILIISTIYIILGVVGFYVIKQAIDKNFQNEISFAINVSLAAIDPEKVKAAAGLLPGDISQSENFKLLKEQSIKIGDALTLNSIDAIYVLTEINGVYYFLVESTAFGKAGYVLPGAVYEQPPQEVKTIFKTKLSTTTAKYTDEYGTYISKFNPIFSPSGPDLVGVLGVDVDYSHYEKTLLKYEVMIIGIIFSVYLICILLFLYYKNLIAARVDIKRNEEKITTIINTIRDGVVVTDESGKIVFWNNACQNMFGHLATKTIGKRFDDLVVLNNVRNVRTGQQINYFSVTKVSDFLNQVLEIQVNNPRKKTLFLELIISTVDLHGSTLNIGLFKDITERKKREEDLNKMNKLMIGRETKMIELKEEIASLKNRFNG